MMREYSTTTRPGSCTPQKTAEPSIAGVKKGRPAIVSTTRNQSATAPAPMSPAMNPSRRIRVSCIDALPWKAPECEYGGTGYSPARPHDLVPTARLPAVPARRLAARGRGGRTPSRHRGPGRPEPARRDRPKPGVARDPLGVPVQLSLVAARVGGRRGAPRGHGGGEPGPGRRDARHVRVRP